MAPTLLVKTFVKPEMDATVPLLQVCNSVTATMNCTVCSKVLVILEKMRVLYKAQLNAQPYGTVTLHKFQFWIAVILLYNLRNTPHIGS